MPATDTPTATTGPTDAEVADVFDFGRKHATFATKQRPAHAEVAHDAMIDAILWSRENWRPELGGFVPFAKSAVCRFVARHVAKSVTKAARRGPHLALEAQDGDGEAYERADSALLARPDTSALSLAVEELPPELRQTLTLYFVHGYKLREVAALTGVPFSTARNRLLEAARLLGAGLRLPRRPVGARRVKN